jgi:hypothetical protein
MNEELYYMLQKRAKLSTNFFIRKQPFKEYLETNLKIFTQSKFNKYQTPKEYSAYVAEVVFKIAKRLEEEIDFKVIVTIFKDKTLAIGLKKGSIIIIDQFFFEKPLPFDGEAHSPSYKDKDLCDRTIPGSYKHKKSGVISSYEYSLTKKLFFERELIPKYSKKRVSI